MSTVEIAKLSPLPLQFGPLAICISMIAYLKFCIPKVIAGSKFVESFVHDHVFDQCLLNISGFASMFTGLPKGVCLTHRNIVASIKQTSG